VAWTWTRVEVSAAGLGTAAGVADEVAVDVDAAASTAENAERVDVGDDTATGFEEVVVVPCPVAMLSQGPPRIPIAIRAVHAVARRPRDTEPNHQIRRLIFGDATRTAATAEQRPRPVADGARTRDRWIMSTTLIASQGFYQALRCRGGRLRCLQSPQNPVVRPTLGPTWDRQFLCPRLRLRP
jgi:hypothetical protein